jgi:RsiW-degrading membrane proteinase PrsW (M82 family)
MAPALAIILWVYVKDKYEKEPLSLLFISFFFGVLSIVPAIVLELSAAWLGIGEGKSNLSVGIHAFLVVALSEEGSKYLFLRGYAWRKRPFNEPFDGIVYAVMIGMGFAMAENIMYVLKGGIHVGLLRAFTAVPLHAACAILMGFWVGAAKFSLMGNKHKYQWYGLISAIFIHGLYDYFLMQRSVPLLSLLAFVVLFISIRMSLRAVRINQRLSPFRRWKLQQTITEHTSFPEAPLQSR